MNLEDLENKPISFDTKHIEYSAYCIEAYMKRGDRQWVRDMMIYRQATVNEMFLEDADLEDSLGKRF